MWYSGIGEKNLHPKCIICTLWSWKLLESQTPARLLSCVIAKQRPLDVPRNGKNFSTVTLVFWSSHQEQLKTATCRKMYKYGLLFNIKPLLLLLKIFYLWNPLVGWMLFSFGTDIVGVGRQKNTVYLAYMSVNRWENADSKGNIVKGVRSWGRAKEFPQPGFLSSGNTSSLGLDLQAGDSGHKVGSNY